MCWSLERWGELDALRESARAARERDEREVRRLLEEASRKPAGTGRVSGPPDPAVAR